MHSLQLYPTLHHLTNHNFHSNDDLFAKVCIRNLELSKLITVKLYSDMLTNVEIMSSRQLLVWRHVTPKRLRNKMQPTRSLHDIRFKSESEILFHRKRYNISRTRNKHNSHQVIRGAP